MIHIYPTTNKQLIETVITNPALYELSGYSGKFEQNPQSKFLKATIDTKLAGLFEYREINKITIDCHLYILPEFQGNGKSIEMTNKAIEWLYKNTKYFNLIVTVPIVCVHIHKFLKKLNMEIVGQINKGIVYNKTLMDLILYQLIIRGPSCQAEVPVEKR